MNNWLHKFLIEMRHRRVWRVVAAYAVGAYGLLEVADLTVSALDAPPIILTWLFLMALCGFPIAVALAWIFDFTSEGIKRAPVEVQEPKYRSSTAFIFLLVLSIAIAGATGWFLAGRTNSLHEVRAIAVLPLINLTGEPDQDYFVDGIHESLIAEIARLPEIDVISRTSAMQYRGTDKSLQEIGDELGIDTVVEGSILRAGNNVTFIAKLVSVNPERNLWSGQYERTTENMATLQREVVLSIAREIRLSLRPADEIRLTTSVQVDARAQDALLRGRAYWRNQTSEDVEAAIAQFNSALAYDPQYASAYASLAESFVSLSWVGQNPLAPDQVFPRAKAAAFRALQIDSTVADAHSAVGIVAWRYQFDATAAEDAFARAVELEPSNAQVLHWLALFLATRGRFAEAEKMIDRALELDPMSLLITANRGWIHYFAGRPSIALSNANTALQLWPESGIPYYHRGLALLQLGRVADAIDAFSRAIELSGPLPYLRATLAYAQARSGATDAAEMILAELENRDYTAPYLLAMVELGLGRKSVAFDRLEAALNARDAYLAFLAVDPVWEPLRSEDRFAHIMEEAGHTIR